MRAFTRMRNGFLSRVSEVRFLPEAPRSVVFRVMLVTPACRVCLDTQLDGEAGQCFYLHRLAVRVIEDGPVHAVGLTSEHAPGQLTPPA